MKVTGKFRILCLVAALSLWTIDAAAQKIHTYSDNGTNTSVSTTSTHIPGAPVPSRPATQASGEGEAARPAGEQGEAGEWSYYEVSLQGGGQRPQSADALARILGLEQKELYRGVIPGKRDRPAHLERAHIAGQKTADPNQLTWIGFVPEEKRTRVFLQAARTPQYQIGRSDDGLKITVTLENTRLPQKNFSRFIDTSFFKRGVTRIETAQQRGGSVQVTIQLDARQEPTVTRDGDYIYLDFPHTPSSSSSSARTGG
ncbi:MAG: AMIN domain-containing protein [Bradymonadaceae bacterium]|nr:AMIN domain-containing protein [Lujinxingiaceae bacterium]